MATLMANGVAFLGRMIRLFSEHRLALMALAAAFAVAFLILLAVSFSRKRKRGVVEHFSIWEFASGVVLAVMSYLLPIGDLRPALLGVGVTVAAESLVNAFRHQRLARDSEERNALLLSSLRAENDSLRQQIEAQSARIQQIGAQETAHRRVAVRLGKILFCCACGVKEPFLTESHGATDAFRSAPTEEQRRTCLSAAAVLSVSDIVEAAFRREVTVDDATDVVVEIRSELLDRYGDQVASGLSLGFEVTQFISLLAQFYEGASRFRSTSWINSQQ